MTIARLSRIANSDVPLKRRALASTNGIANILLGRKLGLVHVVEFPKSGGSWIANMIRTYLGQEFFSDDRLVRKGEVIQVHRTHTPFFRKPIVVVRDPRDAYVSYYYFETKYEKRGSNLAINRHFKHDENQSIENDFSRYLEAKLLYPSNPWFSYSAFVDSWLDRDDICLIRYEHCLESPAKQIVRMLRFINEPIDQTRVESTITQTSFENMTKTKYGCTRKRGQADSGKFLRKGISGDWKNHFNEESCQLIEKYEGSALRRLGYVCDNNWIKSFLSEREQEQVTLSETN